MEESFYEQWKARHKFNSSKDTKRQFEAVDEVRTAFEQAKRARQNGSYWYTAPSGASGSFGGVGNWEAHWDKQKKAAKMIYRPLEDMGGYKSNVKSPMILGRIQSTLHKWKKLNYGWIARPKREKYADSCVTLKYLVDDFFQKADVKEALNTWVEDALTHGKAFVRLTYVRDKRKYSFPETDPKKLTKEQKKQLEEDRKTVWKEPVEKVKYDDLVIEPVSIWDLYVDPQALCLHGTSYEARWVVRRRLMHYDDFAPTYGSDPEAINVDKVQPCSSYENESDNYNYFRKPTDIADGKYVEVLEYENQRFDKYIVVANDILVKNQPLPWSHKEISYHEIYCSKVTHQFYAMGLADLLMNTQGAEEILLNMMMDKVYESMKNQFFVSAASYGEISRNAVESDSKLIPLDTSLIPQGINGAVAPVPYNQIGFDAFRILDQTSRMAIQSTQVDPNQMGMITQNTTATLGMINQNQAEAMLMSLAENFVNTGLTTLGRQIVPMIHQYYTETLLPKDKKEEDLDDRYKYIRLEGRKIVEDPELKKLVVKEDSEEYSFFKLDKKEYFPTSEQVDIRLSPETMESLSKLAESQKAQQLWAQLINYAVDPSDTQKVMQHPLPLFNAVELAKYLIKATDSPKELLLNRRDTEKADMAEAILDMDRIMAGEVVPGRPGRSDEHLMYESRILTLVTAQIQQYEQLGQQIMMESPQNPQIEQLIKLGEDLKIVEKNIADHLESDSQPLEMTDEVAIGKISAPAQPPTPQGGADNGQMSPEMGGAMPNPNDLALMAMQEGGMPDQINQQLMG